MNTEQNMTSGYLSVGDGHIYLTHHTPAADVKGSIIILPPFAEERKSSYRLLVEMAVMLAESGWHVYRFDPRGMGESTGHHGDMTLNGWQTDCQTILNNLDADGPIWFLGARLGANIALQMMATEPDKVTGGILWEPLMTGEGYLRDMTRRKQIKEMMGCGRAESGDDAFETAWSRGETVDLDGFEIGPEFRRELGAIQLVDDIKACTASRILLCHVGGARTMTGPWAELENQLTAPSKATCIRQKPFWGLLDYQEHLELKEITKHFLETPAI